MSWSTLRLPLTDLLVIQARLERLQLVKKLGAAEIHLRAAGLDPTGVARVRKELLARPIVAERADFVVPPPPPADGSKPLRYLMVTESSHG